MNCRRNRRFSCEPSHWHPARPSSSSGPQLLTDTTARRGLRCAHHVGCRDGASLLLRQPKDDGGGRGSHPAVPRVTVGPTQSARSTRGTCKRPHPGSPVQMRPSIPIGRRILCACLQSGIHWGVLPRDTMGYLPSILSPVPISFCWGIHLASSS